MKNKLKNKGFLILSILMVYILGCKTNDKIDDEETSKKPLERLISGNERFRENHPVHPDQTIDRIRELGKGQHPFAVIISCSDSRVPPELIFDQGLGDLFIIRNAGNIISDYELGSIEYAVEHLDTKLIVVLGHKQCGAIGAFIEHKSDSVKSHIQSIIDYIKSEPEEAVVDEKIVNYYDKAILANVEHGVTVINNSEPLLKQYIKKGKAEVVGMLYDIETGKIELVKK